MAVDRNKIVAISCAASVAGMIAMSYAAVPLYKLYCQVTGYGGTTQRAEKPSDVVLDRVMTVRFDANVDPDLPWKFRPVVTTMKVKVGETVLAFYRATNLSDKTIKGTAGFNVTPDTAGVHFNKIECFCFTEQTLAAGETVDMPLTFFIDPEIVNDIDARHLSTITLSYRFYPSDETQNEKTTAVVPTPVVSETSKGG